MLLFSGYNMFMYCFVHLSQVNYSTIYINNKLFCYLGSNLATSFFLNFITPNFLDHIYCTIVSCVYKHIILKSQYPKYSSVAFVLFFYYMLTTSARLNTKPGFYISCLLCSLCVIPSISQFLLVPSTSMTTIFPKLSSANI